jgi:hypothetical protein
MVWCQRLIGKLLFLVVWGSVMSIPVFTVFSLFYNRVTVRRMRQLGATSPESAKTMRELHVSQIEEVLSLRRLLVKGKVKEIVDFKGEKRYYLMN